MICILGLDKSYDFITPWNEWCRKIEKYGRLEYKRNGIQAILNNLDVCSAQGITISQTAAICM